MKNSLRSILSDGKWRRLSEIRFQMGLGRSDEEGIVKALEEMELQEVAESVGADSQRIYRKKQAT